MMLSALEALVRRTKLKLCHEWDMIGSVCIGFRTLKVDKITLLRVT